MIMVSDHKEGNWYDIPKESLSLRKIIKYSPLRDILKEGGRVEGRTQILDIDRFVSQEEDLLESDARISCSAPYCPGSL